MPSEDTTKLLEFNQYQKSDKAPFIILCRSWMFNEKIDECGNNLQSFSTTKAVKNIAWRFSVSTMSWIKKIKIKHDVYRGKFCIKKVLWILKRAHKKNM